MINDEIRRANKPCWFVMRCREAERMEAFIEEYNSEKNVLDRDKIEDFFIPSLVIRKRIAEEDRRCSQMRSTLRRFVFLYARPSAFEPKDNRIATRYWNMGRTRLGFYTDGKGEAITVRPEMMRVFINGCLEYLERFEIQTKKTDITEGIEVTVRSGAFKDFKAEVFNVRYKAQGVRFSLAIKFFANDRYINIHDMGPEDVMLDNEEASVFSGDFIDRIQTAILAIIRRRVFKTETPESREADRHQLHQLYYLHQAIVDDALRSAQLDALMSICASLLGNSLDKGKYNRKIKQRLKELRGQEVETGESQGQDNKIAEAYLLTALYISTKDARYRTELKSVVLQEIPEHKALREFLALVRK